MVHRTIVDGDGLVWDVWEVEPANEQRQDDHPVPPADMPERRRAKSRMTPKRVGWLALQSDSERRRVVPAPAAWGDMSDDELRVLITSAAGTGRPLRHVE